MTIATLTETPVLLAARAQGAGAKGPGSKDRRGKDRRGKDRENILENLSANLMDLAILIGVAAGVGFAIHLVLRASGYGPNAALVLLPLCLVVFVFSALWAGTLGAAILLAAVIGHAWRRQDAERGGVEGRQAGERKGLRYLTLGYLARRRWRRDRVQGTRLALGPGRSGEVVTVPFGASQGVRAFIPGGPGSGKSVDLALHATAYISAGQGCLCLDPKRDRDLRARLEAAALANGRRFVLWTPEGPATYNPLKRGTPSEITDKALAGESWTEPHYLRQAQRYLNLELTALQGAGEWPPTLRSVVRYLDPERLAALAEGLGERDESEDLVAYLDSLSARQRSDLAGVRDRLAVLAESGLGRLLEPSDGAPEIDLRAALETGDVVYFELDSDRFPLVSQMLGAALVSDLVGLTGEIQGSPLRALIMIDEFAAIAAEEVSRLLGRSRSAGLSVLIATQAFADLSLARPGDSSESLRRQVLSHVDYVIAHRQSEPEAAELLGQMAGTKPAWSIARSQTHKPFLERSLLNWNEGSGITKRRTRSFIYHPDEFKRLGTGEAIVIEPTRAGTARLVEIWSPVRRSYPNAGRLLTRSAPVGGTSHGQNGVSRD